MTGLDYTNGGSYYIDASSDQDFSFLSLFDGKQVEAPGLARICKEAPYAPQVLIEPRISILGCDEDNVIPILVSPTGEEYDCSSIGTGGQQRSSWLVKLPQSTPDNLLPDPLEGE